jgi:hypothetical protein
MVPHPRKGLIKIEAPLPAHISASFEFFGFEETRAGEPFVSFEEDQK